MACDVEEFYQVETEKYIQSIYGKEQWVQVFGHKKLNGADAEFCCGIIDLDKLDDVFKDYSWDIHEGECYPGFPYDGKNVEYRRNISEEDGKEALIYKRNFYGIRPSVIEISEEFRLLNNLYFESSENFYYSVKEDGQIDLAVRVIDDSVFVKLNYLIRYISAKQKALLLFYDIRYKKSGNLKDNNFENFSKEYRTGDVFYSVWSGESNYPSESFSVLMGKKIIRPRVRETCGYWPYEKQRSYAEFIIGIDENGEERKYTSDPAKLSNNFGANTNAPHYLTPVFFKKEVLHKYYADPKKYKVTEGRIECGYLWSLSVDLDHKEYVMAYLGDLGRDLPESEQDNWKAYNVLADEAISRSSFLRDFGNIAISPEIADVRFKILYRRLNQTWEERYGWPLFLPLVSSDEYNLDNLRIPLSNNQEEFDQQVLALNKILVDSLNEKQISKYITVAPNMKGISKFEEWCLAKGLKGYENGISFMRKLQELRSAGTGHRKGKSYAKIGKEFGVEGNNFQDVFENILLQGIELMECLYEQIIG